MNRRRISNLTNTLRLLPCRQWYMPTIALIMLLIGVASANAQMIGGQIGGGPMGGGHGGRQRNQQKTPQPTPAPPSPAAIPVPWPRLDSGTVLCKSRDDLISFQTRAAAASSDSTTGSAPDCLIIQTRTAIKILDRDGPSRSHVISTDSTKQTGWTNAYLPATPPAGVTTTATAGR
jgi:hypothetical protein